MNDSTTPGTLTSRDKRTLAVVGTTILVVVFAAVSAFVMSSRTLHEARALQGPVQHTRDVLEEVQQIFSTLQDAETGERGYVITGDTRFLEPFRAAQATLDARLERLQLLLVDPRARELSNTLAEQARQQMTFLQFAVDRRREGDRIGVEELIRQGTGKRQMDAIRGTVAALKSREQSLLQMRQAEWSASTERAERVSAVSFIAAIASVMLSGAILLVYARRQLLADRVAKQTAAMLQSTVESITQGVIVFDSRSRILAWNQRYLELRRIPPNLLEPGMDVGVIQKHAAPMRLQVDAENHDSRTVGPGFGDLSRPFDGEGFYDDGHVLQVSGRPALFGHYVVTATDITALKNAEAEQKDEAIRLNSILDNIVDAIITINEDGVIESWSSGAEKLFGYSEGEMLNANASLLLADLRAEERDSFFRTYLSKHGQTLIDQRMKVDALHKNGQRIHVELVVGAMQLESRRLFIGVAHDISHRLEVERLKSGIVATVSHELRTPLTSISGSLGLIQGTMSNQIPPQALRLIEIAQRNSDRLVRLINDILDLEKSESGKLDFNYESLELRSVLQQVVDANKGFAHKYEVNLELVEDTANAFVRIDRDRLQQVMTNLISNAVKFSPKQGTVRVQATHQTGAIRVSVSDEGPGIPPEFRERTFQKFAQADSSDSRAKSGTGLGLAIAKSIIENMGGEIGFDTDSARGACFFILLPVLHRMRNQVRSINSSTAHEA